MEARLRHRSVGLADGTRIAVQEGGRAGGPFLLLLPGQANSHDWWTGLRDAFEADFTTLTFDYRGTGATGAATGGEWSTALFAQDAVHVLDACGASRTHVYGTSMGGRVAQMLAIGHPDRVERLVLAGTTPGGALAVERSQQVRRELSGPGHEAALLRHMYTPAWFAGPRVSHLLGDPAMTARARALHLRASARHDARLAGIGAATLILHGGADEMAPVRNATLLRDGIAGSELVVREGGRHGFFDEFRAEVTPRVLAHLTRPA